MSLRRRTIAKVMAVGLAVATAGLAGTVPVQAVTSGPTCGTKTYLKPDGTPWVCTFSDDFSGSKLDTSKWTVLTSATSGYPGRPDCFVDTSRNESVGYGYLKLSSRRERSEFTCTTPGGAYQTRYSAAMVSSAGKFAQAYGRYEIRASFPSTKVQGLQSSLWLWPTNTGTDPWPTSGEIDLAEWYSKYYDRVVPYLHHDPTYPDPNATNNFCMVDNVGAWHTYVLEWLPNSITISYDGQTCLHDTDWSGGTGSSAPFDKPYMISLTQALGMGDNAVTSTTPSLASAKIDYVRVWS